MKTMQELYDEIIASRKLKAQFLEAAKAGKTEAFLKEHGCEATMEQVAAFLKEKVSKDEPLSVNDMENAAGGICYSNKERDEIIISTITAGLGCVISVIISASNSGMHVGKEKEEDGSLCSKD